MDLSGNKIKEIHPKTFSGLAKIQEILLHHNELESVSDKTFENLENLIVVELNDNKILYVAERSFVNLPKLEVILLDHNRLQNLDCSLISSLPVIKKLSLHDNFWMCNCCLRDLIDYVVENSLSVNVKCSFPERLKSKLWGNVNETDFMCKQTYSYDHHGGPF